MWVVISSVEIRIQTFFAGYGFGFFVPNPDPDLAIHNYL
jgi:hypothetical protein